MTAALIIGYVRLYEICKLVQVLERNDINPIYISFDGPKINDQKFDLEKKELIKFLTQETSCTVYIRNLDSNYGTAVAVISAIDWFFKTEECGLIIEDDLEINDSAVEFLKISLSKYRESSRVWMISANQYFPNSTKSSTRWCNYPLIWGWGTWARRWQEFRNILDSGGTLIFPEDVRTPVKKFLQIGYQRARSGGVDSWAIPYSASMRAVGAFGILPPVNLVSNFGGDRHATHTKPNFEFIGAEIDDSHTKINFTNEPEPQDVKFLNSQIENRIYGIKFRHNLIQFYSPTVRIIRLRKIRKGPLMGRLARAKELD